MKTLLTLILCAFCLIGLQAQVDQTETTKNGRELGTFYHMKNSHSFNLGVGFPNLANTSFNIIEGLGGGDQGGASPNFTFKYEYGLTEELGVGLHVGYYTAKTPTVVSNVLAGDVIGIIEDLACILDPSLCDTLYATEDGGSGFDRIHATTLGVRGAYHRNNFMGIERLDVYGTVLVGYSFLRTKRIGDANANVSETNPPKFIYNTSAGMRYFFTPKIGMYAEVGYGSLTVVNMGMTYRIIPMK